MEWQARLLFNHASLTTRELDIMTRNEGPFDRLARIVAGLVLLFMAIKGLYTPWTWIGVVPLLTGLIGWCPAYALFGWNTCKAR
jgi:Protein of unknown function (DUF2892)